MSIILSEHYHKDEYRSLKGYKELGGYESLKKALKISNEVVVKLVKDSNLRGRGGAGFNTGTKWMFLPESKSPRYLLCNADEGEPGTFKDRWMMHKAPHQLIEGMLIAAYAIKSPKSYIYLRGEYSKSRKIIEEALNEAYKNNILGKNILGFDFSHEMDFYCGAGAYICGEEFAMISSLEGKKGQPKLKPPFPAIKGYLGHPTIVNNVETFINLIYIVKLGVDGYKKYGTEQSPGTKIFSVSGNVKKPGNYEKSLGYSLKDLIYNDCEGMINNKKLKGVIPGGISAPILSADEVEEVKLDYESLMNYKTMLGSGGVVVIDDSQCMVQILKRISHFFHHESCGQCSPCREGTGWINKIVHQILLGRAKLQDLNLIISICKNMRGKTICAFSDAAALPIIAIIEKYRDEFEFFIRKGYSKIS